MNQAASQPKRRTLHFDTLEEVVADVRAMVGTNPTATGGWSPGQIVEHVAKGINGSVDGFGFTAPLPLRLFGRLTRNHYITKGFPSGIKLRGKMADAFLPSDNVDFDQAAQQLATAVDRAKRQTMTAVSPMFGKLTHEQWVQFNCRHAELHFSFLQPTTSQ